MAHEARLTLGAAFRTNTHCDPQHEPIIQVMPLSGWTKSPPMGLAMPISSQS